MMRRNLFFRIFILLVVLQSIFISPMNAQETNDSTAISQQFTTHLKFQNGP